MKNFLLFLVLAATASCNESATQKEETDIEVAENYIESFEPEKAIPYLEKISSDEPEYAKAQKLLQTINGLYNSKDKASTLPATTSPALTSTELKKIKQIQEGWAKRQMREYGKYFSSYRIENPTKVVFILRKLSSANGTIQSHEEMHVPILRNAYEQAVVESGLNIQPIDISFERKGTKVHKSQASVNEAWIPAEYLYEGVGIYFGQGNEKRFLGNVVRGYVENGEEYVVLVRGNHEEIKSKAFVTENANCFLKMSDPKYQGHLIRYK